MHGRDPPHSKRRSKREDVRRDEPLLDAVNRAAHNNSLLQEKTRSAGEKLESARRHLDKHTDKYHSGHHDGSSGESVENYSTGRKHRSEDSSRHKAQYKSSAAPARSTGSVLYSAELQHVRRHRSSDRRPVPSTAHSSKTLHASPTHRRSDSRRSLSPLPQSTTPHPRPMPRRLPPGRDYFEEDEMKIAAARAKLLDRDLDETLERSPIREREHVRRSEEYSSPRRENSRRREHSDHRSPSNRFPSSIFHARCAPPPEKQPRRIDQPWTVDFFPGTVSNVKKVEQERRVANVIGHPNAEHLLYQEEKTRRQEEELARLAREATGGRTTKQIFDQWMPLDAEKASKEERRIEKERRSRGLWETATDADASSLALDVERGAVEEDEAGYALPMGRPRQPPALSTPTRGESSPEQFFTPVSKIRPSLLGRKDIESAERRPGAGSDLFDRLMDRERGAERDRSIGSPFVASPHRILSHFMHDAEDDEHFHEDHGEEMEDGHGHEEENEGHDVGTRMLNSLRGMLGSSRHDMPHRTVEEEKELIASAFDRSSLDDSMHQFDDNINRSMDALNSLMDRLSRGVAESQKSLAELSFNNSRDEERGGREGGGGGSILGPLFNRSGHDLPPFERSRASLTGISPVREAREPRQSLPVRFLDSVDAVEPPLEMLPPEGEEGMETVVVTKTAGLAALLHREIAALETSHVVEEEALRIEGASQQLQRLREIATTPISRPSRRADRGSGPSLDSSSPGLSGSHSSSRRSSSPPPRPQLSIATGGSSDIVQIYEERHGHHHGRGRDTSFPSPRLPRSPSPRLHSIPDPYELRNIQSLAARRSECLDLVNKKLLAKIGQLYKIRFARMYAEKKRSRNAAEIELIKKKIEDMEKEFAEKKRHWRAKAVDETINPRDLSHAVHKQLEKLALDVQLEFELQRRMEKRQKIVREEKHRHDIERLNSSLGRLEDRSRFEEERQELERKRFLVAKRVLEQREEGRRLERSANEAVALADASSDSFSLPSGRREMRVTPREETPRYPPAFVDELKAKLEEKKMKAEAIARSLDQGTERLTNEEVLSVEAQLRAHEEFERGAAHVERAISTAVQPSSPRHPPQVAPLDLSSLTEDDERPTPRAPSIPPSAESEPILEEFDQKDRSLPSTTESLGRQPIQWKQPIVQAVEKEEEEVKEEPKPAMKEDGDGEKAIPTVEEKAIFEEEKVKEETEEVMKESGDGEKDTPIPPTEEVEEDEEEFFTPLNESLRSSDEDDEKTPRVHAAPEEEREEETPVNTEREEETPVQAEVEQVKEEEVEEAVDEGGASSVENFSPLGDGASGRSLASSHETIEEVKVEENEIEEAVLEGGVSSSEGSTERSAPEDRSHPKMSVLSEMTTFTGFVSSEEEGEGRKEEREEGGKEAVKTPVKQLEEIHEEVPEEEFMQEEPSEGGWDAGGFSARSEDFDWGDGTPSQPKEEEVKTVVETAPTPVVEEKKEEEEEKVEEPVHRQQPAGKFAALRERLASINAEEKNEVTAEEKEEEEKASSGRTESSSTATGSSSTTATSSSRTGTSSNSTGSSSTATPSKEEVASARSVPSFAGSASSASGSIDFGDASELAEDLSTPRVPPAAERRFRLSLPYESPRSSLHGPGSVPVRPAPIPSPRTTHSPSTPGRSRAHQPVSPNSSSILSPSEGSFSSRSRFATVMPTSPRGGTHFARPEMTNLSPRSPVVLVESRLSTGFLDDSLDISSLSAVQAPVSIFAQSGSSILPPIAGFEKPSSSAIPSRSPVDALGGWGGEEDSLADHSVSMINDVVAPTSVFDELRDQKDGNEDSSQETTTLSSPGSTATAESDSAAEALLKEGSLDKLRPLATEYVSQIWEAFKKEGRLDEQWLREKEIELEQCEEEGIEDNRLLATVRMQNRLMVWDATVEAARNLFTDYSLMEDGRRLPSDAVPDRGIVPSQAMLMRSVQKALFKPPSNPLNPSRVHKFAARLNKNITKEDELAYEFLYEKEMDWCNVDAERREIIDIICAWDGKKDAKPE